MSDQPTQALSLREAASTGLAMTFDEMRARVHALDEFYRGVMHEGTDYGVIPGTQKPTLYQPGAQLLDGIFGLAPTFEELPTSIRDWDRGIFAIDARCRLVDKRSGTVVAEGIGHCNSKEDRYRWRSGGRSCPSCGAAAIIKSKFGAPGWLCWDKRDGCGARFEPGDARIEGEADRQENDDPYSLVNTLVKMAQKRAHIAATLNATGASRIFTQDVEDMPEFQRGPSPAASSAGDPDDMEHAASGERRADPARFQQGNGHRGPTPIGAGDQATPAQVRAIYLIGRDQHGMTDQAIDERSVSLYQKPPAELTKKQASHLITVLKANGATAHS